MINRLTGGVVLSGMLIGSGLMMQNTTDDFIHHVGGVLMILTALGALILIWSVFRSGGT